MPDVPTAAQSQLDVLALDEALNVLASNDARKARAIELRALAGLSFEEFTQVLDISRAKLARDFRSAQVWLYRALNMSETLESAR